MPRKKPTIDKIRASLSSVEKTPSTDEFLFHFFHMAGGPKAVASLLYQEFVAARPGSIVRSRCMEAILRALKYSEGNRRTPDDLGLLSEDDLDRLLESREAAVRSKLEGQAPDGEVQEADPQAER